MKKNKLIAFMMAIPAFFLIFIFKIIPVFTTFIMSFKNYSLVRGMMGSPWVGFSNFAQIFSSQYFIPILRNTFTLGFLSIILSAVLAFGLVYCIANLPNKWIKCIAVSVIAVPLFMPVTSYVYLFFKMSGREILMNPGLYPVVFAVLDTLKNLAIPVIVGVLVCEKSNRFNVKNVLVVLAGYMLFRATALFSPDLEMITLTYNPIVYSTADVFDTYNYRQGIVAGNFAFSSASWIVKTVLQFFVSVCVYIAFIFLNKHMPETAISLKNNKNTYKNNIAAGVLGTLLISVGSLLMLLYLAATILYGDFGMVLSNANVIRGLFNSILYGMLASIIFAVISFLIAYGLFARTKWYPAILIFLMIFSNNITGEHMFFRGLGLINTPYAVVISSSISVIGAFAIYYSLKDKFKEVPSIGQYFTASLLPLVSVVILFFIANYGSYLYQLIFLRDRSLYGIGMISREMFINAEGSDSIRITDGVLAAVAFISSFIPIVMGTALIWLNKFIPLTGFSSQTLRK